MREFLLNLKESKGFSKEQEQRNERERKRKGVRSVSLILRFSLGPWLSSGGPGNSELFYICILSFLGFPPGVRELYFVQLM